MPRSLPKEYREISPISPYRLRLQLARTYLAGAAQRNTSHGEKKLVSSKVSVARSLLAKELRSRLRSKLFSERSAFVMSGTISCGITARFYRCN